MVTNMIIRKVGKKEEQKVFLRDAAVQPNLTVDTSFWQTLPDDLCAEAKQAKGMKGSADNYSGRYFPIDDPKAY